MDDSLGEFKSTHEPTPIAVCCPKLDTSYLQTATYCVESMTYEPNNCECKACGYKTRCEVALVKYKRKHLIGRRKING